MEADVAGSDSPFDNLPPVAPLEQRLTPALQEELDKTLQTLSLSREEFEHRPAPHIALVLQATQAQRPRGYARSTASITSYCARRSNAVRILELEGTTSQLDLLRALPDDGNELLQDTLTHWHDNARLLQVMMSWWLEHPPAENEMELPGTFSQPLHEVLMQQRNQAWCDRLFALPPVALRRCRRGAAFVRRRQFTLTAAIENGAIAQDGTIFMRQQRRMLVASDYCGKKDCYDSRREITPKKTTSLSGAYVRSRPQ